MRYNIFRKVMTRPISYWERNRAYPIRQKVFDFPPLRVDPRSRNAVVIMSAPSYICESAWAAYSLLRRLSMPVELCIVIDGEISSFACERLQNLFSGVSISSSQLFMEESRYLCPRVAVLGETHPMLRKLAVILTMQQKKHIIYSDSDVLCLHNISEVEEGLHSGKPLYIKQEENSFDNTVLRKANELRYLHADGLNAGFLVIPKDSLRIKVAEELLDGFQLSNCDPATWWWIEQTIVAVLMKLADAQPLPTASYVVNSMRQWYFQKDVDYEKVSVRHFVSPVRHLMYSRGMPRLSKEVAGESI